jgi:RsiW-degrading membrane proteinase PrsW (M82 family)
MITGVLTGVIIGAGFAVINNLYTCFKGSFVETEYAPMIEVLIYNDALINSLTKVMKPALIQCLLHSVFYVLIGAILGGCFVNAFNRGFKDKVTIYILIVFAFVCWAFATLWVVPFTSILFDYILKAVMTITSIIAVVKTVRTGLQQNTYV